MPAKLDEKTKLYLQLAVRMNHSYDPMPIIDDLEGFLTEEELRIGIHFITWMYVNERIFGNNIDELFEEYQNDKTFPSFSM